MRYRVPDVVAWLKDCTHQSTAEYASMSKQQNVSDFATPINSVQDNSTMWSSRTELSKQKENGNA